MFDIDSLKKIVIQSSAQQLHANMNITKNINDQQLAHLDLTKDQAAIMEKPIVNQGNVQESALDRNDVGQKP